MINKTLVAYFTKGGATEEYAKAITETLTAEGIAVDLQNLALDIPDVTSFDTIVLGTGVRISRVYRRWRKVLKQKSLRDKHLYLFLSSGTAIKEPDNAVVKFLQPVVDKYGLKPLSMTSFPGKIPEKWAKLDGGKETMKLEDAKAWAEKIASQIQQRHG